MSELQMIKGQKPILATDVDEVLFPFVQEFAGWHNYEYGTQLSLADFHSYEFESVLQTTVPETVHRVHAFLGRQSGHLSVSPIEEASEAVNRLAESFEIQAITARHPSFELITAEYLDRYFGGNIGSVILVGHAATMETLRSKAEVCRELGAIGMVDDSVTHITGCLAADIDGVLFGNYPWNQLPEGSEVVRCNSWKEVIDYFER